MLSSCKFSKALEWLISLWAGKERTRSELTKRLTVIIFREHLGVQRSGVRVLKTGFLHYDECGLAYGPFGGTC